MEHNTVIWSPYKLGDITSIENVQRKFTKRLPGLKNYTYLERLAAANLDTLEFRRLRFDLIMACKLNIDCDLLVASRRELKSRVWQCFERTIVSYV